MKTHLFKPIITFLFLWFAGTVLGQTTYTGFPTSSSAATCPTASTGGNCSLTFNPKYKLYVTSISGNTVNLRLEVCTGSTLSTGTFYLKEGDACGNVVQQWAVSGSTGPYDFSINVSHLGTKNYVMTNLNSAGTGRTYSNSITITGTSSLPPTLKTEPSCFNIDNVSVNEGGVLSGSVTVRNIGSSTYSGQITIFISRTTSSSTQEILRQQTFSISSNAIQTIYFNKTLTSAPGSYRIWAKYSNAPNGGEQYIENNSCTTCSGLGCLSTTTPTSLITINGSPNLVCGTSTVTPTQPVQNQPATFSFQISNTGSANYTGQLKMMWRNATSGVQLGTTLFGLGSGNSHTFTDSTTSLISAPGTWYLQIEEANGNVVCSKTVTVVSGSSGGCVQGIGNTPATTSPEYQATQYLCSNGIIDPVQNWTDNYNLGILRKDIAKIAYLGLYKGNTPNSPARFFPVPFNDMQQVNSENTYWLDAVKTLAYLQYNDQETAFDRDFTNFRPDQPIQRKYAVKMFLEAFNIAPSTNTNSPFSDVNTSTEMFGYIKKAHELGLMTGNTIYNSTCTSGTCFHPDANITRQEAFVLLWRILTFSAVPKPTLADLGNINNYFVPGNYRYSNFGNVPEMGQGNFNHYQKTSFSIAGRSSIPLDFTHTYNSFLTELPKGYFEDVTSGQTFRPLGVGWTHTYNIYAVKVDGYTIGSYTEPAKILFYYPDGSINAFNYTTNQPADPNSGIYDTMARTSISGGERITITTKNQTKYVFENASNGNFYFCKSIKDRNNNGVKINWDNHVTTRYRISSVQEEFNNGSTGRSLTFNYGSSILGYLSSVTDNSIGRTVNFNVNITAKNLMSYTDPKGLMTSYQYDVDGYNTSNLLTQITLPKGNKIKNNYVNRKLKASQTFTQGGVVSSTTNVNWTPNYSASTYNSSSIVTDPNGKPTSYSYNDFGNPTNIQSPTGTTTINSYGTGNNAHLPTSITVDGITTTMSYDTKGNLLSTSKNGINNSYTYNSFNDVLTHKDGNSNTTSYSYDGSGNLSQVIRPGNGGSTSITRNSFGQVLKVTNPSGIATDYAYNGNGLTNQVTLPLAITTSSNYDNASRLLSVTDANGKTTSYEYDPNNNVTKITDANNNPVIHTYDANNNHLTIKNVKNETQTNSYNFDDDMLASESFGPHTKTYTYNVDGSLATYTRGNGTFTYTYDGTTGRLLNDGHTQYTYDSRGNVKTIKNTNGTLTLNYDNNDQLINYQDYFGNTVAYTYDNNKNVTSITYPGSKTVNYAYDANNRCTSVTDWNGKITTYTYLTDDRISQITLPNGAKTIYSYDAAGRPTGISNKKSNNTVISEYLFTLDKAGNHLSETINEPSIITGLQSISNATVNYGSYPYNRIQSQNSTNFTHNTAGGVTNKGSNIYTFDINDNLLTANGSYTAQYSYDGSGNRRTKINNGNTTRYVLSILGMSQVLMDTNGSNAAQNYYIYGPTGLLYRVKPNNTNHYYHYDFRGSTTAITDQTENITHSYSYDPYGNVLAATEADFNPYRYVGKSGVQFENNDLVFMRARYYDPTTGRFVSEDPIWHLNLYPYADNNPVMNIDPNGKASVIAVAAMSAAATEAVAIGGMAIYESTQLLRAANNQLNLSKNAESRGDYKSAQSFAKLGSEFAKQAEGVAKEGQKEVTNKLIETAVSLVVGALADKATKLKYFKKGVEIADKLSYKYLKITEFSDVYDFGIQIYEQLKKLKK